MKRVPLAVAVVLCLVVGAAVLSQTRPTGNLKVATPGVIVELKSDKGPAPLPNGKEVALPAAAYTPVSITAYAQDKAGLWSIKSTGPFGQLASIEVKANATTILSPGPPLTVKPIIYQAVDSPTGKVVPIGLAITGNAGEVYSAATVKKGQLVMPPPQVKILDASGNTVVSGQFEYG